MNILTLEEKKEYIKCFESSLYFIEKYVLIQHPLKGVIPFNLYYHQILLLQKFKSKHNVILQSRQTGITELICAYMLWVAIFTPNRTILSMATTGDEARSNLNKVHFYLTTLPHFLQPVIVSDNKNHITFGNRSRIIIRAITENAGCGLTLSLVCIDGLAYVNPTIQKECWDAIVPGLSTSGKVIIASGANKAGDTFHKLWEAAKSRGNKENTCIPWYSISGRDCSFKDEEIKVIGSSAWNQQYEMMFTP